MNLGSTVDIGRMSKAHTRSGSLISCQKTYKEDQSKIIHSEQYKKNRFSTLTNFNKPVAQIEQQVSPTTFKMAASSSNYLLAHELYTTGRKVITADGLRQLAHIQKVKG